MKRVLMMKNGGTVRVCESDVEAYLANGYVVVEESHPRKSFFEQFLDPLTVFPVLEGAKDEPPLLDPLQGLSDCIDAIKNGTLPELEEDDRKLAEDVVANDAVISTDEDDDDPFNWGD